MIDPEGHYTRDEIIAVTGRGHVLPTPPTQWLYAHVNMGNIRHMLKRAQHAPGIADTPTAWDRAQQDIRHGCIQRTGARLAIIVDQVLILAWPPGMRTIAASSLQPGDEQLKPMIASIIGMVMGRHFPTLGVMDYPNPRVRLHTVSMDEAIMLMHHWISTGQGSALIHHAWKIPTLRKLCPQNSQHADHGLNAILAYYATVSPDDYPMHTLGTMTIRIRETANLPDEVMATIPVDKRPIGPVLRKIRVEVPMNTITDIHAITSVLEDIQGEE